MRTRPHSKFVQKLRNRRCPKCGAMINNQRTRCKKCGGGVGKPKKGLAANR